MPSTRIHCIASLTMIVLSLVIVPAAESAGQRYALLVGVGAYYNHLFLYFYPLPARAAGGFSR